MGNRYTDYWSAQRIADLCERYGSGERLCHIAKAWGITRSAVNGKWDRLLNETAPAAEWEADLLDAICDALAVEVSFDTIAEKLGISVGGALAAFSVLRRQMGRQAR